MHRLITAITATIFAMLALAPAVARYAPLRVMSFNVRVPVAADGANAWDNRRDLLVRTIADARPDVIGTQELHKAQGDYIVRRLPAYAWFGIDRRGGHADEHMGIFYRRDRFRIVESGHFWLSDTPAVVGSISWGHPLPRMVSWALMETVDGGRRFALYNTHFPYRAEDEDARGKAAALIRDRLAALPADLPVVLTGDFNTPPQSEAHRLLTGLLADVWDAAPAKDGPDGTFHGFSGTSERRIDWILARGFQPIGTRTLTTHDGAAYPSDHFPVIAELAWPAGR